ncbi:hypothetical protein B0H15DRAFT_492403 [Mycena belliarum]|uniref:Uncharacterized protein n=1 Tax=Mycena belliarum TaxID=1033014 RepID=A0AAD6TUE6_9AGAR|nr:hypothetical protein B0H15DRAFT_492403 [Mycena belliae]
MNFFMSTRSCRFAVQRAYWGQRRTFLDHPASYRWVSPVFFTKDRGVQNGPPVKVPPQVTTLHPHRLTDANYIDLAGTSLDTRSYFRQLRSRLSVDPHSRQYGCQMFTGDCPFPPETRGFLYFRSVPDQSPYGGGLRFRVAATPDKGGFLGGHDLLMPHGLPWHIPIWELCTRRIHGDVLRILKEDGFAPPEMIFASEKANVARDSVFITALGQRWPVDFQWEFSRIYLASPGRLPIPTLVQHSWYDNSSRFFAPSYGRGLVSLTKDANGALQLRLEKVLRLVKRTTNVKTLVPEEGSVTPFVGRIILKSTKKEEAKLRLLVGEVHAASRELPWEPVNHNPLDVYQYPPLSEAHKSMIWAPPPARLRSHFN